MKKVLVKWKLRGRDRNLYGDETWAKAFWIPYDKYKEVEHRLTRIEAEPGKPELRPVGRPSKHANNAAKQKAYRRRKRARQRADARSARDRIS